MKVPPTQLLRDREGCWRGKFLIPSDSPFFSLFLSLSSSFPTIRKLSLSFLVFGPSLNSSHFVSSSLCPFYPREPISTNSPGKLWKGDGKRWRRRERRREDRREREDFRGCLLLWRPSGTKRWAIGVHPAMVRDTVIQNVCTPCIWKIKLDHLACEEELGDSLLCPSLSVPFLELSTIPLMVGNTRIFVV